jgi:transposase
MRNHPPTLAYVQRHRAEGKTDREIRRCIKRYFARHLYRTLNHLDMTVSLYLAGFGTGWQG